MNWIEFAEGIRLSEDIVKQVELIMPPDETYIDLVQLYEADHEKFFKEVLKKENASMYFLALYLRMSCDTYEKYKAHNVPEKIFWDTFQDIRFWCDNHQREYGTCGIGVYDWFWRLFDMTLFRLGRLQFEEMDIEYAVGTAKAGLNKGTKVISIHIPQGVPLDMEECISSLKEAFRLLGTERPYVCHSWLLYPGLNKIIGRESNIIRFQSLFSLLETDYKEREAEWRIFGRIERVISNYPESTSLQKNAKEYLLQGNVLGNGWGTLVRD